MPACPSSWNAVACLVSCWVLAHPAHTSPLQERAPSLSGRPETTRCMWSWASSSLHDCTARSPRHLPSASQASAHTYAHTYMHVHTFARAHIYTCAHTTYIRVRAHTHTHSPLTHGTAAAHIRAGPRMALALHRAGLTSAFSLPPTLRAPGCPLPLRQPFPGCLWECTFLLIFCA